MAAQSFSPDHVRFLSSPEGAVELLRAAELPLSDATVLADLTRIRRTAGAAAGVVVSTVRLRRRAVSKLGPVAAGWLFTDEALQQATPGRWRRTGRNGWPGSAFTT